jgi:hypothetical protein
MNAANLAKIMRDVQNVTLGVRANVFFQANPTDDAKGRFWSTVVPANPMTD